MKKFLEQHVSNTRLSTAFRLPTGLFGTKLSSSNQEEELFNRLKLEFKKVTAIKTKRGQLDALIDVSDTVNVILQKKGVNTFDILSEFFNYLRAKLLSDSKAKVEASVLTVDVVIKNANSYRQDSQMIYHLASQERYLKTLTRTANHLVTDPAVNAELREVGRLILDCLQAWGEAFEGPQHCYRYPFHAAYAQLRDKHHLHFPRPPHDPERVPILLEGLDKTIGEAFSGGLELRADPRDEFSYEHAPPGYIPSAHERELAAYYDSAKAKDMSKGMGNVESEEKQEPDLLVFFDEEAIGAVGGEGGKVETVLAPPSGSESESGNESELESSGKMDKLVEQPPQWMQDTNSGSSAPVPHHAHHAHHALAQRTAHYHNVLEAARSPPLVSHSPYPYPHQESALYPQQLPFPPARGTGSPPPIPPKSTITGITGITGEERTQTGLASLSEGVDSMFADLRLKKEKPPAVPPPPLPSPSVGINVNVHEVPFTPDNSPVTTASNPSSPSLSASSASPASPAASPVLKTEKADNAVEEKEDVHETREIGKTGTGKIGSLIADWETKDQRGDGGGPIPSGSNNPFEGYEGYEGEGKAAVVDVQFVGNNRILKF